MITLMLNLVVFTYRLIPAPVRGLWRRHGSTSHMAYGGWPSFTTSIAAWWEGWDGITR